METKIKQVDVRVLRPNEGCLLTQSADVDVKERIFSEEIWLASTDSADNWKDITIEEADQIKKEQEAAMAEEQASNNQITEYYYEKDYQLLQILGNGQVGTLRYRRTHLCLIHSHLPLHSQSDSRILGIVVRLYPRLCACRNPLRD